MSNRYVGLTIGPILDTINLTSSPAALWAASYMFSSLSKCICRRLTEDCGVEPDQIVTPYYDKEAELLNKNDGVGLFHDRVFFRKDSSDTVNLDKLREAVIEDIAKEFKIKDVGFLKEYIMIAHVEFDGSNPILDGGRLLDALELSKPYVFESEVNPILSLFTNNEGGHGDPKSDTDGEIRKIGNNDTVKALLKNFEGFQLEAGRNEEGDVILKSLHDITRTKNSGDYKRGKYYAIVRSDGDKMSEIIGSLDSDKSINDYSKTCLKYCSDVAKKVGEHGGVTIYAGGDDLLAILPSETVFDFVGAANDTFNECFESYKKPTSLSFGIFIAYNEFPLYEALEQSADLLFGVAKKKRNCIAVKLQKHSRQSEALLISNQYLTYFADLFRLVMKEKDQTLLSAMHKVDLFKSAFSNSFDYKTIHNLFINTFDADIHKNNNFVHIVLPNLFRFLQSRFKASQTDKAEATAEGESASNEKTNAQKTEEEKNADMIRGKIMTETSGIFAVNDKGVCKDDSVKTFCYILRILKFFIEKEGDRE